jgi:hypothetical protein
MKKIILLLTGIVLVSCGKSTEKETNYKDFLPKTESKEIVEENPVFEVPNELSEKQLFLKENGLPAISISEDDFNMLKKAYEVGIFKNKSFCEFYGEYKTLEFQSKYKESDKVIANFSKVEGLEMFFAVNGYKLCPDELAKAKEGRYSTTPKQTYYEADNACVMSTDFIKLDLVNPSTADFSIFDCTAEKQSDGSYVVLRKVGAKNALGVKKEYIYKLRIAFLGGNKVDISRWKLIGIISEEYGS